MLYIGEELRLIRKVFARFHRPDQVEGIGRESKERNVRDEKLDLPVETGFRGFLVRDFGLLWAQSKAGPATIPAAGEVEQCSAVTASGIKHLLAAAKTEQSHAMIEHLHLCCGRRLVGEKETVMNVIAPEGLVKECE